MKIKRLPVLLTAILGCAVILGFAFIGWKNVSTGNMDYEKCIAEDLEVISRALRTDEPLNTQMKLSDSTADSLKELGNECEKLYTRENIGFSDLCITVILLDKQKVEDDLILKYQVKSEWYYVHDDEVSEVKSEESIVVTVVYSQMEDMIADVQGFDYYWG